MSQPAEPLVLRGKNESNSRLASQVVCKTSQATTFAPSRRSITGKARLFSDGQVNIASASDLRKDLNRKIVRINATALISAP
jgi:hypothetical protein